jgi:hypothetical protein
VCVECGIFAASNWSNSGFSTSFSLASSIFGPTNGAI